MGCRSILVVAAVAVSLLGVDASPCKPATSTAVSVIQSETLSTVASEATSTALFETSLMLSTDATSGALVETTSTAEDTSATLLETTLTTLVETTPTTLIETTSTEVIETTATTEATTSVVLTEETSTALATSTTTGAPTCVETQVVVNPGFDDNTSGRPWIHTGDITQEVVASSPNSLDISVANNDGALLRQELHKLEGNYKFSFRWTIAEVDQLVGDFSCTVQPKIGDTKLPVIIPGPMDIGTDFKLATGTWSTESPVDLASLSIRVDCTGQYYRMKYRFDDITLTSVCDDDAEPSITSTTLLEITTTTLAETASTTLAETALTSEATTSATLTEESSTTLAASTTTTEAEACIGTQVIVNPGFDDKGLGYPWTTYGGDMGVSDGPYYSAPKSMMVVLYPSESEGVIWQPLSNLKGKYALSYRFKVHGATNGQEFTCSVRPKIGDTFLQAGYLDHVSVPFAEGTAEWSTVDAVDETEFKLVIGCFGQYDALVLHFDDITLTTGCDADLKPKIE